MTWIFLELIELNKVSVGTKYNYREKFVNIGTIVEIPFLVKAIIIGIWLY